MKTCNFCGVSDKKVSFYTSSGSVCKSCHNKRCLLNTQKGSQILIRIPKSLHLALKEQAKSENISVNRLIVCMISTPLYKLLGVRKPS